MTEAALKAGRTVDENILYELISARERNALYNVIDAVIGEKVKLERSRVVTQQFFNDLMRVKGMDGFVRKVVGDKALDLATREGRVGVMQAISSDRATCREFVELVLGKGLSRQEELVFPTAAKKTLLAAIVKPSQRLEVGKDFQHALKDVLRPRLKGWVKKPLYEIRDVNVRAERRVSARYLNQAIVISDDAGENFAKRLVNEMSPLHRDEYITVKTAGGAEEVVKDYFDPALKLLREETQGNLVAQIRKAMLYKLDNGVLDFVARPVNWAFNVPLGELDRFWSKRIGIAAKTILTADPEMGWTANPRLWRRMLLRQAYLAGRWQIKGPRTRSQRSERYGGRLAMPMSSCRSGYSPTK